MARTVCGPNGQWIGNNDVLVVDADNQRIELGSLVERQPYKTTWDAFTGIEPVGARFRVIDYRRDGDGKFELVLDYENHNVASHHPARSVRPSGYKVVSANQPVQNNTWSRRLAKHFGLA